MLVPDTLAAIANNYYSYAFCLILSGLIAILINYAFFKNVISGLFLLQVSFMFNLAVILFGAFNGSVSVPLVLHFLLYEILVTLGIYIIYKKFIKNNDVILDKIKKSPINVVSIGIIIFNVALFWVYLVFVPADGASRIEFMTNRWFSFLRPLMSILLPLGFFLSVYLLDHGKRFLPLTLLASLILTNIASGSKASFLVTIVGSLLVYQQLKGSRILLSKTLSVFLVLIVISIAAFTLYRLDVGVIGLAERFVKTSESTIMVYFSDTPNAACSDVSIFAAVHRGVARLFSDTSAMDIDTLFGFALNAAEYGSHFFTGPTAQIPSYMLCNYSGLYNVVGIVSIMGYFLFVGLFIKVIVMSKISKMTILLFPFVVTSLNAYTLDYYQGVSDLTLIFIIFIVYIFYKVAHEAVRKRNINNYSCR
jgi:hypothetical protein